MMGLSIRMGLLAIALISSSSGVSDGNLSSLNLVSVCRMSSIAGTPNKRNTTLISLSVGGISKYFTSVGSKSRSSSKANADRDLEQRGLCQIVVDVMCCPQCRESWDRCCAQNTPAIRPKGCELCERKSAHSLTQSSLLRSGIYGYCERIVM